MKDLILGIIAAANDLNIPVYSFHVSSLAFLLTGQKFGRADVYGYGIEFSKISWRLNYMLMAGEVDYTFEKGYFVRSNSKNGWYEKAKKLLKSKSISQLIKEAKEKYLRQTVK